ncbi:MAG: SpoIIE family protein phosphatase [Hyphomicrobiales bacterium]
MRLSTRIALIVSAAFLLAFAALVYLGLQRETLAARPFTRIAIAGQEALWREILLTETRRLVEFEARVAADEAMSAALARGDLPELRKLALAWAQPRLASGEIADLQIIDRQGQLVVASSVLAEPPRLLDISTIGAIIEGARPQGIRQVSSDHFRIVVARRYGTWGGAPAVLAVGADAKGVLRSFAQAIGAESFLVSTRGRLVEGTSPDLWNALSLELPQRVGSVGQGSRGERLYAVTAIPLADLSAGSAGLLVAAQDATESIRALDRLTALTVGIMLAVAFLTIGGLYAYLRFSFNPLEKAVGVLTALAKGDTSAALAKRSDDEIGEIASAIGSLRGSLIALNDARRQRELQRRRQEHFVRRQMAALAETLEAGAREEVLADLDRIVAATRGNSMAPESGGSVSRLIREDDQLGPIAAVLQQMSGRVVDQHRRLSELVARLREALVRETQLASLQQELAIARELQRSVLPADFPPRPAFEIRGTMQSAREVGGDFYDFFERRDGRIVLVIADVSGKGVPGAFFMAIARTLLKAIALFENDPANCIRQLNELLARDNDQMMFVTLFFAVFDPSSGHLDYVNAGHPSPVLLGCGAPRLLPTTGNIAAGVMGEADFSGEAINLAPGEALVLFTDGVTEAFSPDGVQFGEGRLLEALGALPPETSADDIAKTLIAAVKTFEAGADQSDDITLLALRYLGQSGRAPELSQFDLGS